MIIKKITIKKYSLLDFSGIEFNNKDFGVIGVKTKIIPIWKPRGIKNPIFKDGISNWNDPNLEIIDIKERRRYNALYQIKKK